MRVAKWIVASLIAATMSAPVSIADDMQLRYITLYDGGWYNVDPIMLHWKTPEGETFSKKMGAKIGKGEAWCYNLKKDGRVPTGSEVWIIAKIESGENKNCKKDRKHIYNEDSNAIWWLKMGGTTLNNNRCENVSSNHPSYTPDTTIKGNSTDCAD